METWQTYPIEFRGGLITNLSPLQQGLNAPGSATILRNFEPSIEGGYRRINGFTKYNSNIVPPYGAPVVNGASQTGTTLNIANIHKAPEDGDTLTIAGVTGTYTVSNFTFDAANNRAALTLSSSLDSSPANAAACTFTSTTSPYSITGIAVFGDDVIVQRNNDTFKTSGSTYTQINVPSYGTVKVNGGSQTGSSLVVDDLVGAPRAGDVFTIAGIDNVYTVTSNATVTSGGATLAISPALASSPADNATLTFLSLSRDGAGRLRHERYNFDGTDKIILVDGFNNPAIYDGSTYTVLNSAPSDVTGANRVKNFKNSLFFAKGSDITFTAVYTDSDFTAANGAGTINVGDTISGLAVFREQLFIFTENSIYRLNGSTIADFRLDPVTRDIGCIDGDTIQEVGTDVMFLGPDGLRLLSATERNGDFSFSNVSKAIQSEFSTFTTTSSSYSSIVIRGKSQYRLFGFAPSYTNDAAKGIIATQLSEEGGGNIALAETRGINAYVADSYFDDGNEVIVFANKSGYIYQLEQGSSFDGSNILATFATPNLPVQDPRVRKTFYKMFLYTDPSGIVSFSADLKLDFDQVGTTQPTPISITNLLDANTSVATYGNTVYGTGSFGGKLQYVFEAQLIGSGYTGSLHFTSDNTNPSFALDAVTIEYANNARR